MPHNNHLNWPSVSQLKGLFPNPSISLWSKKVGKVQAEKTTQASQVFGTFVHDLIERHLRGDETILQECTLDHSIILSVDKFLERHKLTPLLIEEHLINDDYKFHGTPDLICSTLRNEVVVIDWKTSNLIDGTAFIQLAAYAYLLNSSFITDHQCYKGYFCKIDKQTGALIEIPIDNLQNWGWLVEGLAAQWWHTNKNETVPEWLV